jgi:uncharacterized protein (UPF0332 family)
MESQGDVVLYRLQMARQTLEDARLLANASRWNPCVNHPYYACFYAVSGLLLQDGLSSSKHTGVRSLFNRHYVRTRKVPKELAPIYNDLFERRQEGDYMDFVDFEEAQVRPWFDRVEQFIDHLASLVASKRA